MRLYALFLISFLATAVTAQQMHGKRGLLDQLNAPSIRTSGGFDYTLTTLMDTFVHLVNPISINNGEVWDDPEYVVPIGFPFQLNGHDITAMQFAGLGSALLAPTADPDILTALLPFEADLIDRGDLIDSSLSPISYIVEGSPGSRIQKIEFKEAGSFDEVFVLGTAEMFINFQCWLYEGSNMIEFRFGPHMIEEPDFFYSGESGALIGLSDVDFNNQILIHPHFIAGDANKPFLSLIDEYIDGTPPNGMVYRLTRIDPLAVTVTGMNASSVCNPNGSAYATATGGVTPYTYLWSNGATTDTIINLSAGAYTVTVVDNQNDSITGQVIIAQPDPILPNASATDETVPDANDGTASVAPTGGTPPYSILWSTGSTESMISGLAPGSYSVTVTDSAACTATANVFVNPAECLPLVVESSILEPSCHGACDGVIGITEVQGGSTPLTYFWSNGAATPSITTCAGISSVTIIDNNGCIVIAGFDVSEPEILVMNAFSFDETGFNRQDGIAWSVPAGGTPPYTYSWSNGSSDSLVSSLPPGIYGGTVTDSHGCVDSQSVVVLPYICSDSITSEMASIVCHGQCDGGIIVFLSGAPNTTYLWSNNETTNGISGLCAGNYSVTVTNVVDNCVYMDSFVITQPDELTVMLDEVIHLTDTSIASISISVSGGTPPYSFLWAADNGFSGTTEDLTDIPPGHYSVLVTDIFNCNVSLDTIEVLDMTTSLEPPIAEQFSLYPNPVHETLRLEADVIGSFDITLLLPDGRVLGKWRNETRIAMQELSQGLYLLQIEHQGIKWTKPIIKM